MYFDEFLEGLAENKAEAAAAAQEEDPLAFRIADAADALDSLAQSTGLDRERIAPFLLERGASKEAMALSVCLDAGTDGSDAQASVKLQPVDTSRTISADELRELCVDFQAAAKVEVTPVA